MPRTLVQAAAFLLGFGLALLVWPGRVQVARAGADDVPAFAALEAELLEAVNAERAQRHLIPLERRPELDRIARAHSQDMAQRGYLAHEDPQGKNPLDRIQSAGIAGFRMAAENIGTTTQAEPNRAIVAAWLTSPLHRRNLLGAASNATGIGIVRNAEGALLYTQLYLTFARE